MGIYLNRTNNEIRRFKTDHCMSKFVHIGRIKIKLDKSIPIVRYMPLSVKYEKQKYDNWCWAACGTMYINYFLQSIGKPSNIKQCQFAKNHVNLRKVINNLCSPPDEKYDITLKFELLKSTYLIGIRGAKITNPKISFNEAHHFRKNLNIIINQKKRPVIASLERYPKSKGGHLVVIYGYDLINDELYVHDSYTGAGLSIKFKKFAENYFGNEGRWRYSWA